jgi:hypothetical protein
MPIAFLQFVHFSNAVLITLSGLVLVFLLKSIRVTDKLWIASVVSVLLIVLISIAQIVSYNELSERVRQQEAVLDTLRTEYARLKDETGVARAAYIDAKNTITMSRQEFGELEKAVGAEFERTMNEIRGVYSQISDEDLNRRANNVIRRARLNLKNNVFR